MFREETPMRNDVIWAIRDARGLTAQEKAFLFVVESRGEMTTTATKAAEDMGLSRATYYRVRDGLLRKKCLTVRQRADQPSVYVVNEVSLSETHVSHSETPLSHSETKVSHCDNTKKKEEEIEEEVKEERQSPVPDGPVDLNPLNNEVKEGPKGRYFLSSLERQAIERACAIHPNLNEEDASEMMDLIGNRQIEGKDFNERLSNALKKKGVNTDEW